MRTLATILTSLFLLAHAGCVEQASAQEAASSMAVTWGPSTVYVDGTAGQVIDACLPVDGGTAYASIPILKNFNSGISCLFRAISPPGMQDAGEFPDSGPPLNSTYLADGGPIPTYVNVALNLQLSENEPIGATWADAGTGCTVSSTSAAPTFCNFSASAAYYPDARIVIPSAGNTTDGGGTGEVCGRCFLQGN